MTSVPICCFQVRPSLLPRPPGTSLFLCFSMSSDSSSKDNSGLNSDSNTSGSSATSPRSPPLSTDRIDVTNNLETVDPDSDRIITQVRIANRLHAKKGTLPLSVVPQSDSSRPDTSISHLLGGCFSEPLGASDLNPINLVSSPAVEVAGEEVEGDKMESAARTQPYTPKSRSGDKDRKGKGIAEGPSELKGRKRKHHSKGSGSQRRKAKEAADKAEKQVAADKAEEEENLTLVRELTEWWKETRKELRTPTCKSAKIEGEKLLPDWAISNQSSMLKTYVGQDSWELYKSCVLRRDQALLAAYAHTRVKEHHAHALTQALAFGHNLSLKCTYWRRKKLSSDAKMAELRKKLEES
ncbi:hypothetical protein Salat_0076300 [Sesamum alatum]|uniref:Uncharacterized protein n=1 Tax=Sesamum alatum TaxID=300844 RepID=A0AAE1YW88_9LAMI|nr:hypothetical protein Salat_0076300 [Sesamum alatum]